MSAAEAKTEVAKPQASASQVFDLDAMPEDIDFTDLDLGGLVPEMNESGPTKIEIDPEDLGKGLGRLVLTVMRLLHELLEKQAIRRLDAGALEDEQIERLGLALMGQAEQIERLTEEFGLKKEDLQLDLGPLGQLV